MDDADQLKAELRWLWGRICQNRGRILLVGLLGLAGTLMGLGSSVASKYLIDAVTGYSPDRLVWAAVAMAVMLLLSLLLQSLSSRIGTAVHVRTKNALQHETYGRILRAGWEALEPFRSGDLINRLNSDVNAVTDGIIHFLPGLVTSSARFVGAFVIILIYDPVMAMIALAGVPVTLLVTRFVVGKMRRHSTEMKELSGEVMSFQEDSFRNLTSIKAFSVTGQFEQEMERLQNTYAGACLAYNAFQVNMQAILSLVGMAVTASCFGWSIYQLWHGNITYGSMTLFLQLASTLRGAFSQLVNLGKQAISVTTSAGRIMAVENLPGEDLTEPDGLRREEKLTIRLQDTSFAYGNGEEVLAPFAFSACPGDTIAVTGPSGEGKTTLLRLLLGLVQPGSGQAQLVGESGNIYELGAGTRSVFSYVPQGNSIFSGTVAQNLRLINPDATEEEMEAALKTVCAWEFVSQFPDGLNHYLGAGGRGVSEGQAQRLAIARALLRKAPVLLLDEATSGLDMDTEKKLLENLRASSCLQTCILVTHRPGSAEFCNRTYFVNHGSVTEVTYGN